MRMFLERRLFGPGDRVFTWVLMSGVAWLVVGVIFALMAVVLIATVWLAVIGAVIGVFGACLPLWFTRQLLVRHSTMWSAVAALYGCPLRDYPCLY